MIQCSNRERAHLTQRQINFNCPREASIELWPFDIAQGPAKLLEHFAKLT